MYFSTRYLQLLCNLTIYLISKVHIVLQTFLFGTYTLECDIAVGIKIMGILALSLVIFLLAFFIEVFQIGAVFLSFLDSVIDNILL